MPTRREIERAIDGKVDDAVALILLTQLTAFSALVEKLVETGALTGANARDVFAYLAATMSQHPVIAPLQAYRQHLLDAAQVDWAAGSAGPRPRWPPPATPETAPAAPAAARSAPKRRKARARRPPVH